MVALPLNEGVVGDIEGGPIGEIGRGGNLCLQTDRNVTPHQLHLDPDDGGRAHPERLGRLERNSVHHAAHSYGDTPRCQPGDQPGLADARHRRIAAAPGQGVMSGHLDGVTAIGQGGKCVHLRAQSHG
ncbi:hypothetical protein D3C75_462760 [compost metagenome]